jgi:transposase InsO family protein
VAGAGSPWPEHPGQALWAGRRLRRPTDPERPQPAPERHLDVDHPGELVKLDCFCIGRLSGTKGTVWQYTAIDVASAYTWATLQVTRRNPSATWTSQLARTVAADLAERGWKLERVMSDNASEFRSAVFGQTVAALGARHRFIRAGRPQTNGCVDEWGAGQRGQVFGGWSLPQVREPDAGMKHAPIRLAVRGEYLVTPALRHDRQKGGAPAWCASPDTHIASVHRSSPLSCWPP